MRRDKRSRRSENLFIVLAVLVLLIWALFRGSEVLDAEAGGYNPQHPCPCIPPMPCW